VAPELLFDAQGLAAQATAHWTAAAYTSVKRSPRWEHVRELATDPYFSIHHAALKRYASTQSPRFVENDEIVIILMASEQRADRARMQRETWLRNYPHLFIVGDAADPSVPMITLPELEGRATYADAQHRQLRYMRFLYEHRPDLLDKRYSFLVGASLPRLLGQGHGQDAVPVCLLAHAHCGALAWWRGEAKLHSAGAQSPHVFQSTLHPSKSELNQTEPLNRPRSGRAQTTTRGSTCRSFRRCSRTTTRRSPLRSASCCTQRRHRRAMMVSSCRGSAADRASSCLR